MCSYIFLSLHRNLISLYRSCWSDFIYSSIKQSSAPDILLLLQFTYLVFVVTMNHSLQAFPLSKMLQSKQYFFLQVQLLTERCLSESLYESATHTNTWGCLSVLVWAWYVIKQATACILPLKIVASGRTHSNGQEESLENEEGIKQKSAIHFRFRKHNWQASLAGTTSSQLSMRASFHLAKFI